MEDITTKTIMFTTNSLQNGQPTTIYQTADGTILKQPKIENQKSTQEYPTFCYANVGSNGTTVNLAQITSDDNKTCYIAQPIGGYNYALVNNQLVNGTVTGIVDSQGRIQVVNKPMQTNTVSSISFKCDVCGLMFSHLTLLNHHKRIHNQPGSATNIDQNQQQQQDNQSHQITVVTQGGQNILQGQTVVSETGQPLGQIQIVATQPLNTNSQIQQQQQQHQTINTLTTTGKAITLEKSKCIICGTAVIHTAGKRKNAKIRCENCKNAENDINSQQIQTTTINNTLTQHQNNNTNNNARLINDNGNTQIFVAQDGDVKFEMSEIQSEESMDSMETSQQEIIQVQGQQIIVQTTSASNTQQSITTKTNNHPVKKRNSASVIKCQKCDGTGVIFVGGSSNSQQTKHQTKTEAPKPFTCNICGGSFSRYSSLWSHKKLHSGEKNYKCDICGLAFAKAVYLKNHNRIHTGEKPYRCNTCGMQFSQSPHLKNHERTHSGEKPYVCEVCDKGFARHATLWNHRRIHTGEKPYKCDICSSAFSQAAHLKNHAKVHSGEKPFKCDICSAAFADRFALKRHRNIHEKYGQTAPRQPKIEESLIVHKQEISDMKDDDHTEVIISGL